MNIMAAVPSTAMSFAIAFCPELSSPAGVGVPQIATKNMAMTIRTVIPMVARKNGSLVILNFASVRLTARPEPQIRTGIS